VTNTATVTSPGSNCEPVAPAGLIQVLAGEVCESSTTVPVQPTLTISKRAETAQVVAGRDRGVPVEITNTGPAPAAEVLLTDPLPVGLTFVSSDNPTCASADGRVVTCALGDLAPGQVVSVGLVTRAASPLPAEAIDSDGAVPNTRGVSAPDTNCPLPMPIPRPRSRRRPRSAAGGCEVGSSARRRWRSRCSRPSRS
jgi:hypothetical protein